ncbi:2-C-methyl-D-erythritol 4-phosphate cytidylyltransferase [Fibrobacterota bacterium]
MSSLEPNSVGVILPAAGRGVRCGGDFPKQFINLGGQPLFTYSLETFSSLKEVGEIVLVLPEEHMNEYTALADTYLKLKMTRGGGRRWESVQNGFNSLSHGSKYVLIHDTARPFIPRSVIRRCLEYLKEGKDTITALPAVNTVKDVRDDRIKKTLDRNRLIEVQTPQAFHRETLKRAYDIFRERDEDGQDSFTTDEAGLVESIGLPVYWTPGSRFAHKITDQEDLKWAEWMMCRIRKGEIALDD